MSASCKVMSDRISEAHGSGVLYRKVHEATDALSSPISFSAHYVIKQHIHDLLRGK